MNQRIRELAADARGQMVVLTTVDDEQWRQHEEFVEKFAQLILQECLTICQYNTDDDDDQFDLGRVHQAKEITQLIKIHFGVESE